MLSPEFSQSHRLTVRLFYATPPLPPPFRRRRFSSNRLPLPSLPLPSSPFVLQTLVSAVSPRPPASLRPLLLRQRRQALHTMERPRKPVKPQGICLKKLVHDISLHFE